MAAENPAGPTVRTVTEGRSPADDCVHCGFCLPTCPTWQNWQEEMDSPRGRIDLFRALEDGRVEMSPAVAEHFDRCLGCMACLTSCPSGVRYDHVIDRARVRVEREHPRALGDRLWRAMVFALFTRPSGAAPRRGALLWLGRVTGLRWLVRRSGVLRLWPRLAAMDSLAPPVTWGEVTATLPARTPAAGERRLRAALLGGCVQRVFFPNVNGATIRVLAAEGVEVVVPEGQGCCGALSVHAGRDAEARELARDLVERFEREPCDVIAVNAAGCGSHLKDLPHLFRDDPAFLPRARAFAEKVRDVSELLASLPARAPRSPLARARRVPLPLPPRPRPADPGRAARPAPGDPGARARGDPGRRAVLRVGRRVQHRPARERRRDRAAQGGGGPLDPCLAPREREPGLLAPNPADARGEGGATSRPPIPSRLLDRSIRGE